MELIRLYEFMTKVVMFKAIEYPQLKTLAA